MRQTGSSSIRSRKLCESSLDTTSDGMLGDKAWDKHDLLFRYCYYPGGGATVNTDENFFSSVSSPPGALAGTSRTA